jgi:hypothetical protein
MAHWQLRHTYGHGAAKVVMAPAFVPSPYAARDSMRVNARLALRGEHPLRLVARVIGGSAGALVAAVALTLVLAPLFTQPPDDAGPQIVMMAPQHLDEEELLPPPPEPEPVLPEPEPVEIAQEPPPEPEPEPVQPEPPPEPVKVVKKAPPPLPAMPAPSEAPKEFVPTPAPVRVAREAVKKPPAVVSIDPLSPVPAVPSANPAPPPPTRTAARAPAASQRALPALADFTPIGDPAPAGAPAALPARAVRTNVVAKAGSPSRPPAFAAAAPAAPPAAFDEGGTTPALATRSAPARPRAATPSSASRPQSLGFSAAAPSVQSTARADTSVGRTDRALPRRASGSTSGQNDNLAAVPLGSLAACATDREEDERKMALLSVLSGRTECSSAAGRYRFVETKNLNAFLMWIERAPGRPAVDRCVELRLALECLGG